MFVLARVLFIKLVELFSLKPTNLRIYFKNKEKLISSEINKRINFKNGY